MIYSWKETLGYFCWIKENLFFRFSRNHSTFSRMRGYRIHVAPCYVNIILGKCSPYPTLYNGEMTSLLLYICTFSSSSFHFSVLLSGKYHFSEPKSSRSYPQHCIHRLFSFQKVFHIYCGRKHPWLTCSQYFVQNGCADVMHSRNMSLMYFLLLLVFYECKYTTHTVEMWIVSRKHTVICSYKIVYFSHHHRTVYVDLT